MSADLGGNDKKDSWKILNTDVLQNYDVVFTLCQPYLTYNPYNMFLGIFLEEDNWSQGICQNTEFGPPKNFI